MGMGGIRTASPSKALSRLWPLLRFPLFFFKASRVPLQSFGGLIFLNSIIGTPILVVARVMETLGDPGNLKIQMDN